MKIRSVQIYSHHLFREAATRLRELASDCDVVGDTDGHIRDQVIVKCCKTILRLNT